MKFKVIASYVSTCATVIEADSSEEAYKKALKLDGSVFDERLANDDWQIESVTPIKEESNDKN